MSVLKIHLTYACTASCDHCRFNCTCNDGATIAPDLVIDCVNTLKKRNGLQLVILMGGEPGMFPKLTESLTVEISKIGVDVRIETNASWATDDESAMRFLEPIYRCNASLMLSLDAWHEPYIPFDRVMRAINISEKFGGRYCLEAAYLEYPACWHEKDKRTMAMLKEAMAQVGKVPEVYQGTMLFNGRAARKLAHLVSAGRGIPNETCTKVPWWFNGELDTIELLELDPYGNLSKGCGISIGNIKKKSLVSIIEDYDARKNPVFAALMTGGPLALAIEAQKYGYCLKKNYADKCHLCQESREALLTRYPEILMPMQHYHSENKCH